MIILALLLFLVAVLFITMEIGYWIADVCKPLQELYCKIGWHCHEKDYIYKGFDGISSHCKCKWCGYEGMVDTQGNLF